MKNSMKIVAAVLMIMLGGMTASAQQTLKIGHVESEKLISSMPEMAEARKTLEAKQAEVQKESTSLREQYQTKVVDYTKNVNTYSEIIRTSKEQELQELQERIRRFEEIAENELRKTQEDLLRPIYEKATNAIQSVAKANGFTYILDLNAGGVLYHSEQSQDILPLVKKQLGLPE
ncbi:MAG: OmpH family outer membrane protein [Culturomica sp.]|jgi:outer membrane protein|nr:OmpH family outer membrane protein [Culturomica sp.]